jgi:hypothetical protein
VRPIFTVSAVESAPYRGFTPRPFESSPDRSEDHFQAERSCSGNVETPFSVEGDRAWILFPDSQPDQIAAISVAPRLVQLPINSAATAAHVQRRVDVESELSRVVSPSRDQESVHLQAVARLSRA